MQLTRPQARHQTSGEKMTPPKEDGYELWLRYRKVEDAERLKQYRAAIQDVVVLGAGSTAAIIKAELGRALPVLLDRPTPILDRAAISEAAAANALIVGTADEIGTLGLVEDGEVVSSWQAEDGDGGGYLISPHRIVAGSQPGLLTGVFHFLRLIQTHQDIRGLGLMSRPRIQRRVMAHWDNLDGSIERGYAGRSLWNWEELPAVIDARCRDYARACASVGINGTCLNNVNARATSLTTGHLEKAAALADLFRPYGIRVYLSPSFAAPMALGGLETSDPRDPAVAAWWKRKVAEIYRLIPDFGGFQVKANSEGQPGPQDYGAGHHEGANMLADALAPYAGVVLWRAFVYDTSVDADRAKCAHREFALLDAQFRANVFVQVKNGPIDFQPREPFHPLFGALSRTPLALELQITQEYLGQSIHLVYLGKMWEEVLRSDTHADGPGSTVARVVDGSLRAGPLHGSASPPGSRQASCIIGVANTGSERNWCGHHFAQANWYAFGRLAWEHQLGADTIADEWIRMTWSNDPAVVEPIKALMLGSHEACVNYMTPLGLHHLMQEGHHYGPDPGYSGAQRPDWNNVYFHRGGRTGLGFDRSRTGSNAVSQYHSPLREQFGSLETCPEEYLLWFHHVPWDQRLRSDRTLWEELQHRYNVGVASVEQMCDLWASLRGRVDPGRHEHVSRRLEQQLENARSWRRTCLDYFGQFV